MPELEQLLTSVRGPTGLGGNSLFGAMGASTSGSLAGAAGGLASGVANGPSMGSSLPLGSVGHRAHSSDSSLFRSSGSTLAAMSAAGRMPGMLESRPSPGASGGGGGRSAEEEDFGAAMSLLQGSALRGGMSGAPPRTARGSGGANKVPIIEGAELEAYGVRGPLTVMVGRNGETSQGSRGRGNWRRGVSMSGMGRVKFGKGGFARNSVPGIGGAGAGGSDGGGDLDSDGNKRKRAKRGEGKRSQRVRRDPEVEGFKCCYCQIDTRFVTREELSEHKFKFHEGQKQSKQTMPCPVCNLSCKDKHLLAIHMRVHTGERPYVCTKCPAKFRCTSGLNAHLRKHAGLERTFMCFCGESFSSRATTARHQVIYIYMYAYVCIYIYIYTYI